jgi:thioredoxin-related protein
VALRKENEMKYLDYLKANLPATASSGNLNKQEFFTPAPYDLKVNKSNKKPLAVFFEQKDCPDCDTLHNKVLPDKELRQILGQFKVVQLDMWSKTPVTTPQGKATTAREWAKQLDIKFAPSIVVFNSKGDEVIRSEGSFKVFHTQGILDYVLSESYVKQPSFQRYLTSRAEHIREQGRDVDIWNYANEEPGQHK